MRRTLGDESVNWRNAASTVCFGAAGCFGWCAIVALFGGWWDIASTLAAAGFVAGLVSLVLHRRA